MRWIAYIKQRGSLNVGRRVENGFAMLAVILERTRGNKDADFYDYAPHEDRPEVSLLDVANSLGAVFKGG